MDNEEKTFPNFNIFKQEDEPLTYNFDELNNSFDKISASDIGAAPTKPENLLNSILNINSQQKKITRGVNIV